MGLDVEFHAKQFRTQNKYEDYSLFSISKSFYPMYQILKGRIDMRKDSRIIQEYAYELSRNDLLCLLDFVKDNDFMVENHYDKYWRDKIIKNIEEALVYHHCGLIITMYVSY